MLGVRPLRRSLSPRRPPLQPFPFSSQFLFAIERIEALAVEGHPIFAGAAGENITTTGIDWDLVLPGTQLRLGAAVLLEVTRYTTPCKTIARWFANGDSNRIHNNLRPGWSRVYARVLEPGVVRPGDVVEVV